MWIPERQFTAIRVILSEAKDLLAAARCFASLSMTDQLCISRAGSAS
jgi:hypothetical protein